MKNVIPDMTSLEDFNRGLRGGARFERKTEKIPVRAALGRVLASDKLALYNQPNKPVSARDAIAFRYENYLRCGRDVSHWTEGKDFEFANTGVAIRDDFDTAVMVEDIEIDGNGQLSFTREPEKKGQGVNPTGCFQRRGSLLLPKYRRLCPRDLGLLAGGGYREVDVLKKPVVAFIPTGNELQPADLPLPPGKNVETNSLMLEAYIREWGGEPLIYSIVRDDPEEIRAVLLDALDRADIVMIGGGSSKGSEDYCKSVAASLGKQIAYRCDYGPGHHVSATIAEGGKPILGVVGPSVGALINAELHLRPLMDDFLHQPESHMPAVQCTVPEEITGGNIWFYAPACVTREDGRFCVRRGAMDRKGEQNAILPLRPQEKVPAGSTHEVWLLYPPESIR